MQRPASSTKNSPKLSAGIGSGPVDDRDENYSSYCHLKAWGNARAFEETFRAEEAKKLAQERTTAFSLAACFMCAISEKYRAPGADDETGEIQSAGARRREIRIQLRPPRKKARSPSKGCRPKPPRCCTGTRSRRPSTARTSPSRHGTTIKPRGSSRADHGTGLNPMCMKTLCTGCPVSFSGPLVQRQRVVAHDISRPPAGRYFLHRAPPCQDPHAEIQGTGFPARAGGFHHSRLFATHTPSAGCCWPHNRWRRASAPPARARAGTASGRSARHPRATHFPARPCRCDTGHTCNSHPDRAPCRRMSAAAML